MDTIIDLLGIKEIQQLDLASPESWTFLVMLLISLAYGVILNQLYTVYYRVNEAIDPSLGRSLVLLTPTLMTIFRVVQFSLPLSVGLLGTLSFVRFRSPVKRAEDISFIIITLAAAISCAILKPLIGGALISLFLIYSFVRNNIYPSGLAGRNFAVLTYNTKKNLPVAELEDIIRRSRCKTFEFVSSCTYDGITSFVFNIANLKKSHLDLVTAELEKADSHSNINVFFPNGRLGA